MSSEHYVGCHSVESYRIDIIKSTCGKVQMIFLGHLWRASDGKQPIPSSHLSTGIFMWALCGVFLQTNATVKQNKEAAFFIHVSKMWWREGAGHITLSAAWYNSILTDQFSHRKGDEKGAGTRWSKGREGAKMVVLICQRNTVLCVLLKCPHKPELSGLCWYLAR